MHQLRVGKFHPVNESIPDPFQAITRIEFRKEVSPE
jgi:hypothetical protein